LPPAPGRTPTRLVALLVLAGLVASLAMYRMTAQGAGVSPDSTVYIEAARNLRAGRGLVARGRPMTHFPPGYPLALAAAGAVMGNDPLDAARLLASALFGVNLALLTAAVYASTRRSVLAACCGALLFLVSGPTLAVHSMAWSEALYIALSLAGLILLSRHLVVPCPRLLIAAALLVGLAAATRYVGVTLLAAAVLALLAQRGARRARDVLVFAGLACLPLASWLVRNLILARSATNRQLAFHPPGIELLHRLLGAVSRFFLPLSLPGWARVLHLGVAGALLATAVIILWRRARAGSGPRPADLVLPSLLALYGALYLAFLLGVVTFLDANTPADHRILLPVLLALIVVVTSLVWTLSESGSRRWVRPAFVVLIVAMAYANAGPAFSRAMRTHRDGTGYTARAWRESAILAFLSRTPETATIYSNGADVILFLTDKGARWIPARASATSLEPNDAYPRQVERMVRECESGRALIVLFDRLSWREYYPSKKDLAAMLIGCRRVAFADGVIFGAPGALAGATLPNP